MNTNLVARSQAVPLSNAGAKYSPIDICYYLAFAIYCFFHLMERTNYTSVFGISFDVIGKISTALMLVFVCARLLTVRFSLASLVRSALILAVSLLVFIVARSWICLSLALFIIAGKEIDIKPMARILLVTTLLVVALTFLGAYTGAIANIASRRPGETKVRNALGFNQVNALGAAAVRIYVSTSILSWDKKPTKALLLAAALSLFLEWVANSRTSELFIVVLALVRVFCYRRSKTGKLNSRKANIVCLLLIWGTVGLSFVFLFFFNSSSTVMVEISNLLSNRLYSAWYICRSYGVHLFGNGDMELGQTIWAVNSYALLTIDNAWAQWLVMYGSVPTALLLVGISALYIAAIKNGQSDGKLIILAVLLSFYAFGETTALAIDYNPLLVLLWIPIFGCPDAVGNAEVSISNSGRANIHV